MRLENGGRPTLGGREIRVALYCDEPVLAAGLAALIAPASELRLVCTCSDVQEFLRCLEKNQADVALVDTTSQLDLSTVAEISRRAPGCRIVLWVYSVNVQLAHDLKQAGIAGILRKQLSGDLTIRCLKKVAEGELWFERDLMTSMLDATPVRLSPRERQLLDLVSQGLSNKQIASALTISEGTVKVYFSKLFRKVGVSDRFELALFGLQNGRFDETPADVPRFRSILLRDGAAKRRYVA